MSSSATSIPNDLSEIIGGSNAAPTNIPVTPNDISSDDERRIKLAAEIQKEEDEQLNKYEVARTYLNDLINRFREEQQRTEANRLTRDIDIDIDILREQGAVEDDECFIPQRVCDNNIQREMPSYINFLRNSRRIAIFNDTLDPTFDSDNLEQEFTRKMTYPKWEIPHYKAIDSAMTHGWSWVEVTYDPSKPANCAIEYIAHEDLIIPLDSKDVQTASACIRRYKVTPLQLKSWVIKFNFDLLQVNLVLEYAKTKQDKDRTIEIYKRFCKHNGVVYVSWFSLDGGCTDWLKKPAKHYVGIDKLVDKMVPNPNYQQELVQATLASTQGIPSPAPQEQIPTKDWSPVDLDQYPVFLLVYRESEKPYIFDHMGRVFYDKDKQESQTAILTAFVNGTNRAQKVYASPAADTVNDGKLAKQLSNLKWDDGTVFDKPMQFFTMPYPNAIVLKYLEQADVSNSEEIGQTNFAALNREDSRKTAREITAAQQQSQLLDSVDLTLYSAFLREVYSFCWLIVRSQALQNEIQFLRTKIPQQTNPQQQMPQQPNPAMSAAMQSIVNAEGTYEQEQSGFTNDVDTLIRKFDVRAAGDVDVIQKQEMVMQMKQDWPVYQNTPLASRFLQDLTKLVYPQDGAIYAQILQEGNPKNAVIQSLVAALTGIIKTYPDVLHDAKGQQEGQQLNQIIQSAQQALQAP